MAIYSVTRNVMVIFSPTKAEGSIQWVVYLQ